MTEQTTPLRQRMIEDRRSATLLPSTQKIYVRAVANFSPDHGCSPDKLTSEDVRDYRLHLISRGLKATSINPIMGALRLFYGVTLGQKHVSEQIPYARKEDTIYAAGLRVSEAVKLTARGIDGARMVIAIRQSRDRYVMLPEKLLGILRAYWTSLEWI